MFYRGIYISTIKNLVQRYRKNGNIKKKKKNCKHFSSYMYKTYFYI